MTSTATSNKMPIGDPESSRSIKGTRRATIEPMVLTESASKVAPQAAMASKGMGASQWEEQLMNDVRIGPRSILERTGTSVTV